MSETILTRLDWGSFSNLMGDASLFLIVGGLVMLGLVVVLVVLRSFFPAGTPSKGLSQDRVDTRLEATPGLAASEAQQPPIQPRGEALDAGRRLVRRHRAASLDEILETAHEQGLGEARFLRLLEDRSVIRFYHCSECGGERAANPGCHRNAGFLEASLSRFYNAAGRVQELQCRARGDPACEFEVRYAAA